MSMHKVCIIQDLHDHIFFMIEQSSSLKQNSFFPLKIVPTCKYMCLFPMLFTLSWLPVKRHKLIIHHSSTDIGTYFAKIRTFVVETTTKKYIYFSNQGSLLYIFQFQEFCWGASFLIQKPHCHLVMTS